MILHADIVFLFTNVLYLYIAMLTLPKSLFYKVSFLAY